MRRLLQYAGLVIAVLGVAFVGRALIITWPEVRVAVAGANPAPLVAALALASGAIFVIGLGWRLCLAALGTRAPVRLTTRPGPRAEPAAFRRPPVARRVRPAPQRRWPCR